MQDIPDSFKRQRHNWIDIVNKGDMDAYTHLLAENAVWIPPGQQPIIGRKAFKEWLAPFFGQFSYKFSIMEERIFVDGDWIFERAKFISQMTPVSGGEPLKHTGTFTVLWNRDKDKSWHIVYYIDDTNLKT